MWHALRTELVYFRPWLLGGIGIATFVVVLLSGLIRFFEDGKGPPIFLVTMFPIIAGMVVAFVAQGYRIEEHRARLLLAGPLTPRQLAWLTVLLPICFACVGALAAPLMIALATLITGKFEATTLQMIAGFSVQFLAYAQLGPLAQESTAARREQRTGASIAGWAVFAGTILVLAATQFFFHSLLGLVGVGIVIFAAMVAAAILYQNRTDFTR